MTHEVYLKEINSGKIELVINETVKTKARNYIKKYMASKGPVFKISSGKGEKFHSQVLSDLDGNFTNGQTVVNGNASNEINGEESTTTSEQGICVANGETSKEANE